MAQRPIDGSLQAPPLGDDTEPRIGGKATVAINVGEFDGQHAAWIEFADGSGMCKPAKSSEEAFSHAWIATLALVAEGFRVTIDKIATGT